MRVSLSYLLVALGTLGALAPASSVQASEEGWQSAATLYVWLPGIGGRTQFPSGAGGPTINVNAKDVLSSLDMAFMGSFESRLGRWGGLADWVYSDLSGDRSLTREFEVNGLPPGAGVAADLGLRVKTNILTLAGTYTLVESPTYSSSLLAGVRMLKTDQTLNWSIVSTGPVAGLARSGTVDAGATNWDAVVGVRGRARLPGDPRWFVPYHLDIGTGASRQTWQAVLGVGYTFDFGDVGLVWRYLDYTFKPSEPLQTLTFNGLALGVAFRF
ncbi:MAG: hypothetical protein WBA53_04405 [Burkholderiaceae bacterium]